MFDTNGLEQYNLFNEQGENGIEDYSGKGNHIDDFVSFPAPDFVNLNTLRSAQAASLLKEDNNFLLKEDGNLILL